MAYPIHSPRRTEKIQTWENGTLSDITTGSLKLSAVLTLFGNFAFLVMCQFLYCLACAIIITDKHAATESAFRY